MELSSSRSVLLLLLLCLGAVMMMMKGAVLGQSDVREPPTITNPLLADTRYERDDSVVTLKCQASGTPQPTYKWHFEGSRVTDLNPPGARVRYNETTGELVINKLALEQTGSYSCLATNSFTSSSGKTISATAMSPKIQVRLSYVATPWPQESREKAEGTVGQYLAVKCDDNLPSYDGPMEFKWYRQFPQYHQEVIPDERIFIDRKGTLHFAYLLAADDENNLPYSCALSNAIAGFVVTGNPLDLNVLPGTLQDTGPTPQYPTTEERQYPLDVIRSSSAQLQCFFSGYHKPDQAPSMVWSNNVNQTIVSGQRYHLRNEGRILVIRNVDEEDEGPYYCQGKLGGSMGNERVMITLNVTSPPIWKRPLQSQTVPKDLNAVFHCDTRSMREENDPEPPLWYRNGELLQKEIGDESPRQVLSNNNKTLTVLNVQKDSDIACYQCVVRNSVGETFGSACLNVL